MGRNITYDLVLKEFQERGYKLVSKEYVNNSTKLQYICPVHKDKGIQEMTFANFTRGRNCPYCSKRIKRTHEEYVVDLKKANPNIEPLEAYSGLKVKILHKCKICGYEWKAIPDNFLHNKEGCPKCSKKQYKRTQEEFQQDIYDINPNIEVLGTFTKVATKIKFKCKNCGHIWFAKPNNILNGRGCPKCKESYGERKIANWLKSNNILFEEQYVFPDCKNITYLPFDFYIADKNICIEYDGEQHFIPCRFGGMNLEKAEEKLSQCQLRDKIKTEYCSNHNIYLIRISYKDYKNIEKILSLNFN